MKFIDGREARLSKICLSKALVCSLQGMREKRNENFNSNFAVVYFVNHVLAFGADTNFSAADHMAHFTSF